MKNSQKIKSAFIHPRYLTNNRVRVDVEVTLHSNIVFKNSYYYVAESKFAKFVAGFTEESLDKPAFITNLLTGVNYTHLSVEKLFRNSNQLRLHTAYLIQRDLRYHGSLLLWKLACLKRPRMPHPFKVEATMIIDASVREPNYDLAFWHDNKTLGELL